MMYVINGNYGNATIALIQWAYEQKLEKVFVISIDTGFAALNWHKRVECGQTFVKNCGFEAISLTSKPEFADLMRDRKEFPTKKFQWCAGFLKGLALNDWLDQQDSRCEAVILSGKKRIDSRAYSHLPEVLVESEHHGFRKLRYPLCAYSQNEFLALLKRSHLPILSHRSLECDPCVNSDLTDLARLSDFAIKRMENLEKDLGQSLFAKPIALQCAKAKKHAKVNIIKQEMFDMGCGSPFACGE